MPDCGLYGTRHDPMPVHAPFEIKENPKVVAVLGTGRLGFSNFQHASNKLSYQRQVQIVTAFGAFWDQNISCAIERVIRDYAPDYILALDNDSVFDVDDYDKILAWMQAHPEVAAMFPVEMSRHNERPLCLEPFLDYSGEATIKTFGHFGLTLIRAEVFGKIPHPWLWALPGEGDKWSSPDKTDPDILFWKKLRDHGYLVAQHNEVAIGHLELAIIWPDSNAPQLQLCRDYEALGRPKNARWTNAPKTENDKVLRLNLGAGKAHKQGYVSVDRKDGEEVYPLSIPDNSADEIYASHVLEHFSYTQTREILHHWKSKLKPGGVLRIAVPDFRKIVAAYLEGSRRVNVSGLLMGGHLDPDDVHGAIFDIGLLSQYLVGVGFMDINHWSGRTGDTADTEFSLNLQGTKPMEFSPSEEDEQPHQDFLWLRDVVNTKGDGQFGEDSILEVIANDIGLDSGWAFEVGAHDGVSGSNTVWCRERGWPTVMIESDVVQFKKLLAVPKIIPVRASIEPTGENSIDSILDKVGAPEEINLGVIDIDGDDYHVAKAMRRRPKILMVEFRNGCGKSLGNHVPPPGFGQQATQPAIVELGRSLGYEFVANTLVNAIFVRLDVVDALRRRPKITDLRRDGDEITDWSPQDNHLLVAAGAD